MQSSALTETTIPTPSKAVHSFIGASIKVMESSDLAAVDAMNNVVIQEPTFWVKEDDRTYIYSFKKISEAIDTELDQLHSSFWANISMCIGSLLGFAYLIFLEISSFPTFNLSVMVISINAFLYGIYGLIMGNHKNKCRQLEGKKEYVLASSQYYLKKLRKEAQKPVVVV